MSEEITNGLQKWWPVLLILAIIIVIVIVLFQRWNFSHLTSRPDPVTTYEEAVQRIEAVQTTETHLNPLCRTQFLTHGQRTENTILLVHGYTTCPHQFAELGKRFHNLGYNVLIMPLPGHGFVDRMTDAQGQVKAEDFAAYADKVVDIGQGLGERVVISGISLGGAISAWAVQNRSDVDMAMIVSPGFSFEEIPTWAINPIQNIFVMLPATYDWWDLELKENGGPPYAYPRYSKRTLGEIMRLGFAIQEQARQAAPLGQAVLVVTNGNDFSVDNDVTHEVIALWHARGANLSTYEFEASLGLGHDLIDPNSKETDIEIVYPRLIELVNARPDQASR